MSSRFAGQRRIRVGAAVAAALLGIGTVTGCGSQSAEPEPKDWSEGDQKQQNGQEQTGSEQPDEPEEPEEYTFVKQYIKEAIYPARKSGDTSQLLAMGTDDCEGCQAMAAQYQQMFDDGGRHEGDPSEEVLELVDGPTGSNPTILRIKTKLNNVDLISEEGAPPRPIGGTEELREFELVQEGGTWKVSNFCGVAVDQPSGCP